MFGRPLATGSYQAVVVSTTTNRPLAHVTVLDLKSQAGSTTDEDGHFVLPGPVAHFQLYSLGFAILEATRPVLAAGRVDTLRLVPEDVLLSEVTVQPAKLLTLSSLGTKAKRLGGYMQMGGSLMVPGAQFGILFRLAADAPPAVVQQVSIRLASRQAKAGRIRVRLVAPERGSTTTPSTRELAPISATYTAAQLNDMLDGLLTVDLSAYNIQMPASGFFVLIEGLATIEGETYVTDGVVGGKLSGKGVPTIITATNPNIPATFHETPAFDFPGVATATSFTSAETVHRRGDHKPWDARLSHKAWDPGKDGKPGKAENLDVTVQLRAE